MHGPKIMYNINMAKNKHIVEVKNFSISFAGKQVVKNLSFNIKDGEIFGLLGSNGSGKTTTIRSLLGFYQPDAGQLLINGQSYEPGQGLQIGYLPEERGLYKKESVIDTMLYFAKLKQISNAKDWCMNYLRKVDMAQYAKTRIEKLSQGMQQKVQLGITIMGQPKLLILDEPTKGFDPVNRKILMNIIEEAHQKGSTIILITHYMDEAEQFCDHILLLKDGQAAANGSITEIKQKFKKAKLEDIFISIYGKDKILNHEQNYF